MITVEKKRKLVIQKGKLRLELFNFKRDRILEEAAELLFEQGFRVTSVDAIAERLGSTKPFIYYHFESKLDLLSEICQRGTREALAIADKALSESGTPTERLTRFVRDFTRSSLENHKFVMIYFRESIHLRKIDADRINRMRKEIDSDLVKLLLEGNETGEFDVKEPQITALSITGMASFPVVWYRKDVKLSREAICNGVTELSLKMVHRSD